MGNAVWQLCTTVVVAGRETVPPATLCPCIARFVAAERREAADAVETEDNPEIKPASAAACPKAPGGTAPQSQSEQRAKHQLRLAHRHSSPATSRSSDFHSSQPRRSSGQWTQSLLPKKTSQPLNYWAPLSRPARLTTSRLKSGLK